MTYYHQLGDIPAKRHTQFPDKEGRLYKEELVSSRGFAGIYSNLYHIHAPTRVEALEKPQPYGVKVLRDRALQHTHLNTSQAGTTGEDYLSARVPLLLNEDVCMALCVPARSVMAYFYKNAEADEVVFVHKGEGTLYTQFGLLEVREGDYVVIPRTTIYRWMWKEKPRLLVIESKQPVETVRRYRNELGQLLEHAPYCERDIRPPHKLQTDAKKGEHYIYIKKNQHLYPYRYTHSPLDVVGWDGFLFPYALSIYDFEPITGRIHQPPPVHQTFQSERFVICSFVPRLFDYHPKAIPVPYNHSNIDSDEVLYYVKGNFMSRRGIDIGSFTLHPGGLPHGPHPGTVEASLGKKETKEYAVMLDTFAPLYLSEAALAYVDDAYPMSWK